MSLGWRVRSGLRSYVEGVEGVDPLFDKVFLAAGSHPISIIIFHLFLKLKFTLNTLNTLNIRSNRL